MEIIYHGHSCIELKEYGIIFDPFLNGNPEAVETAENLKADYILLTHGHLDHIADALEIAQRNDATIVATAELADYYSAKGVKSIAMNIGGTVKLPFGKVKMTQAFHSSSFVDENGARYYTGMPGGFMLTINDKTIYHAGDTALFSDMKLLGELHQIDVAFLPIGDTFTMGLEDAALAAEWLKPRLTIPVHYNTFPPIQQDPYEFIKLLQNKGLNGLVLNPGEKIMANEGESTNEY